MPRFFNTAGPCKPDLHYMLPAQRRIPTVRQLIDDQSYFVLHAPRQTGKSTALLALAQELTREGRYTAAWLSMKVGSRERHDPGAAADSMLDQWRAMTEVFLPAELQPPPWPDAPPRRRIGAALGAWAKASPRPLVVFLDEADALQDETLLAVLDQLREGYSLRPTGFPWSLALVGLRDIRDYRTSEGRLGSSSPFNIKVESITMRDFTRDEVAELYQQHTDDTGQLFQPDAVDRAFHWTQGQPWLVNALGRQLTRVIVPDVAQPITAADVDTAKEILIQRQDTHLDSLAERLREPRVRRIVEPILAGTAMPDVADDDRRFVVDLGLLRRSTSGGLEPANPIYKEVIPRVLAGGPRDTLPHTQAVWLRPEGTLDPDRLIEAFLAVWRQHGEPLLKSAPYHEVAPQLVLMAFLHRVVNGGGTIDREYAAGSGRMDLCLRFGGAVLGMELKVWRDGEKDPLESGLTQIDGYLASLSLDRGWLVIFDRRSGQIPLGERTSASVVPSPSGRSVVVIRA